MQSFREVKLPSGAVLKVQPAPFTDAKALYQAVLAEAKGVEISKEIDMGNLLKTILMSAFSSPRIESTLWVCFQNCTYNTGTPGAGDLKIDKDTFEPVAARGDYTTVCMEVGEENISPFVKSLYAVWRHALLTIENVQT